MKTKQNRWKLFLLLLSPLFINGICNKDDAEPPKADQYVTWNFTGQSGELTAPTDSLIIERNNNSTFIFASPRFTAGNNFFIAFGGGEVPGTYASTACTLQLTSGEYNQSGSPVQVTVSAFGSTGNYVTGTYAGTLIRSSNNASVAVTGEFRIKRR